MLVVLDLTLRQASRVLEQAQRLRARLEIEPRTRPNDDPIVGSLEGRDSKVLQIDLHDRGHDIPLNSLLGVFCEVKLVLSGQMYMFSTNIVDAFDVTVPQRLLLGIPQSIHLANRRRFSRHDTSGRGTVQIRLAADSLPPDESGERPADSSRHAYDAELCNIGHEGLACRVDRAPLDALMLVGNDASLTFELPGSPERFQLPAIICNKSGVSEDREKMLVGFQFQRPSTDDRATDTLDRLRAALNAWTGDTAADAG